jgi:hypothetical protein
MDIDNGSINMDTGPQCRVTSVIAWNPETKEITSGPAKGQFADNENEAIAKHQEALEASRKGA